MSFNFMTPDKDCNSIPPVNMLEAGLPDRNRKRVVGLNPNSLCCSQRRYTLSYGASLVGGGGVLRVYTQLRPNMYEFVDFTTV